MRAVIGIAIVGALLGGGLGALLGYVEARPWSWRPAAADAQANSLASGDKSPGAEGDLRGPPVVVDNPLYNFDRMEVGTTQRHIFKLTNQTDVEQTVTVANITCQCTGLEIDGVDAEPSDSVTLPPGETVDVELAWEAKDPPRPFRHGAELTASGPPAARVQLEVEGEIVASTTLSPQRLFLGDINIGESKSGEVVVSSFLESKVEILSHEIIDDSLAEQMEVRFVPLQGDELLPLDASSGVKVIATITPEGSVGPLSGRLRLTTNLAKAAELTIPVRANVVGDFSIYGSGWRRRTGLLKIGPFRSGAGKVIPLNVTVRGEHAEATKLSVASIDPSELQVSIGEPVKREGNLVHWPLTITAPPGIRPMVRMEPPPGAEPVVRTSKQSGGEGLLVLATTHPDTPEVRLRLSVTIHP